MTDIIAYCPEIEDIKCSSFNDGPTEWQRQDLIAAALIREIKRRGKWGKFYYWAIDNLMPGSTCGNSIVVHWLFDPSTLIRVAGEWIGREEKDVQ